MKYLDALCVYFWATTPVLISIMTFCTYVLLGNTLTAAKVGIHYLMSLIYANIELQRKLENLVGQILYSDLLWLIVLYFCRFSRVLLYSTC